MVAAPWRANAARASDLPDPMPPVSPTTRAIRLLLGERLFGLRRGVVPRLLRLGLGSRVRLGLGGRVGLGVAVRLRRSLRLLIEIGLHDRICIDRGLWQVGMVTLRFRPLLDVG